MYDGSWLFGLLLIMVGLLLARPGIVELRLRYDRPRSLQLKALQWLAVGVILDP